MLHRDPIPELKRRLAGEFVRVMRDEQWTTTELTFHLSIDQPRVSDVRRGRLERISVERLIRWLVQIGQRVDVTVTQERRSYAQRAAEAKGGGGLER
jgi:predicted XRE-type DNA-binding protein